MAEESVNTSVISGVTNNIYKVPDSVAIESAGSDPKLLWCCIFFLLSILFNSFFLNYRHSLITAVSISTIFDLMRFIILSYFPPL